ncbi:MAG: hypothetical protein ACXWTL_09960 [Methylobacter sp.]
MRFIKHTLTGFLILLVASVAIAKEKKVEQHMDPQAMMELYTKLAEPGEPHKLFGQPRGKLDN